MLVSGTLHMSLGILQLVNTSATCSVAMVTCVSDLSLLGILLQSLGPRYQIECFP